MRNHEEWALVELAPTVFVVETYFSLASAIILMFFVCFLDVRRSFQIQEGDPEVGEGDADPTDRPRKGKRPAR